MQRHEGDEAVRGMLSAAQAVTSADQQMKAADRTDMLATYQAIEAELLPASAAPTRPKPSSA